MAEHTPKLPLVLLPTYLRRGGRASRPRGRREAGCDRGGYRSAANRGNYYGPNLPWRCLRYIIVTVMISRAIVIAGLNELKSPAPCPPTSKAPYSKEKDTSPTHPSFINTEAARLSTCNPRSAWYVKLLTKLSPPSKNAGRKKITTMKENTENPHVTPRAVYLSVRASFL